MTKQERLKAFEMRLDGCNWSQIARAVGYSSTTVHQDLLGCVMTRPRLVNCAYPAIRQIITDQYGGSVSAFAAALGMTQGDVLHPLRQARGLQKAQGDDLRRHRPAARDRLFQGRGGVKDVSLPHLQHRL